MAITGISAQTLNLLTQAAQNSNVSGSSGDFQNILSDALSQASQAEAADQVSTQGLLTGDTNNLSDTMIDSQKATIQLSLAVAIRDRVIEAYNEVMRMQI